MPASISGDRSLNPRTHGGLVWQSGFYVDFSVFFQPNSIPSETPRGPFGSPVLVGLKPSKPQKTRRVEIMDLRCVGYLVFFIRLSAPLVQLSAAADACASFSAADTGFFSAAAADFSLPLLPTVLCRCRRCTFVHPYCTEYFCLAGWLVIVRIQLLLGLRVLVVLL